MTSQTPEGKVKTYLRHQCRKRGWPCYTAPAMGVCGWPDKMILCGRGVVWVAEIKASTTRHGKDHVNNQIKALRMLNAAGLPAMMLVDKAGIDAGIEIMERYLVNPGAYSAPLYLMKEWT